MVCSETNGMIHSWVHGLRLNAETVIFFSWQRSEISGDCRASENNPFGSQHGALSCSSFQTLLFENQEVVSGNSSMQAQPLFSPEKREGPH